jgi:hypothetical protein
MKASKAAALLLIGLCFPASHLCYRVAAQTEQFTLTGQVKVQQSQRLTARLYFPKDMGNKPLLAFVEGNGYFEFGKVAGGSYLLEIYAGSDLIYQKSIDLKANFRVDDPIVRLGIKSAGSSWSKVADNTRLEQRHKVTLNGNEFQGNVAVYVGDTHRSRSFSIIVFKTGGETSRWPDSDRIEEKSLRAAVARDQILSDARISRSKMKTSFTYNGRYYSLDVTKIDDNWTGKADFLNFEIYRKN